MRHMVCQLPSRCNCRKSSADGQRSSPTLQYSADAPTDAPSSRRRCLSTTWSRVLCMCTSANSACISNRRALGAHAQGKSQCHLDQSVAAPTCF
eukprot:362401-Chlamydomonas_euryale.AAC.6